MCVHHIYIYVYIYICIIIFIHIHAYIYIYIYTHTYIHALFMEVICFDSSKRACMYICMYVVLQSCIANTVKDRSCVYVGMDIHVNRDVSNST